MRALVFLAVLGLALPASAQTLDTRSAAAQLFSPDRETIQVSGSLSARDKATVKTLIPLMEKQMRQPVEFYSSIAYVPSKGLASEGLQGAFNYHSPQAADRAALRACTASKPRGSGECRIAARVLPRGYKARPLTLSAEATRAFEARYRRTASPKVFAVSPSTGAWGIGGDARSATARCARGGARDCRGVIAD